MAEPRAGQAVSTNRSATLTLGRVACSEEPTQCYGAVAVRVPPIVIFTKPQ